MVEFCSCEMVGHVFCFFMHSYFSVCLKLIFIHIFVTDRDLRKQRIILKVKTWNE